MIRPNPFLKMNVAEKLASLLIHPHRPPQNRFGEMNHSIIQTATYCFNSLLVVAPPLGPSCRTQEVDQP